MRSLSCTGSSQSCGPRPDQIAHLRIADAWPDLSVRSSAGRMWWSGGVHLASGSHEALGTTTSGPRRPRSESLASMFPRLCSSIIHFHFLFDQEVQVIDDAPCPSVFFSPLLRDGLILNAANQYRCGLLCRSAIAERVAAFAAWYSAVASILFFNILRQPLWASKAVPRPGGLGSGAGPPAPLTQWSVSLRPTSDTSRLGSVSCPIAAWDARAATRQKSTSGSQTAFILAVHPSTISPEPLAETRMRLLPDMESLPRRGRPERPGFSLRPPCRRQSRCEHRDGTPVRDCVAKSSLAV